MKLSSFELKIIAIVLMILDHIASFVPNMSIWFSCFGRLAAPIFFFMIVEGFFHTRDAKKYAARLFSWALIMYGGSKILMFILPREKVIHNNIFLSLGMSVVIMITLNWLKKIRTNEVVKTSRVQKKNSKMMYFGGILLVLVEIALTLVTEASMYAVVMTLVFYFLHDKKSKMVIVYIVVSLILTIGFATPMVFTNVGYSIYSLLLDDVQWMMVFAFPFFIMYNGERGFNSNFMKHFFYAFYPLHIWILYVIGYWVTGR